MSIDEEKITLSKPKNTARECWSRDSQSLVQLGEDELVQGEFGNEEDKDWTW